MHKQDPYTFTANAVDRLYVEWKKHPKLIVAVDFDDTLYDFHGTGNSHQRLITALKKCNQLGFYVVLWSASKPDRYAFMREFATFAGIEIASVNENPIPLPFGNDRKMYYNILLDDRAGLGQALDTLEITMSLIESQQVVSESGSDQEEAPKPQHDCSNYLLSQNKSYPRTCRACGLGPCKYQTWKTKANERK